MLLPELKVNQKLFCLFAFIVSFGDDVFPNLQISLQILFTVPVSIASCKRSFSKFKLTLLYEYSRVSIMGQDRLSVLVLLSVQRQILEKKDFNNVVDQFSDSEIKKNIFMVDYAKTN